MKSIAEQGVFGIGGKCSLCWGQIRVRNLRCILQLYLSEIGFSSTAHSGRARCIFLTCLLKRLKRRVSAWLVKQPAFGLWKILSFGLLKRGLSCLDLIEEETLDLSSSVEKFDPERGFRFQRYGLHGWITKTIERAIYESDSEPFRVCRFMSSKSINV